MAKKRRHVGCNRRHDCMAGGGDGYRFYNKEDDKRAARLAILILLFFTPFGWVTLIAIFMTIIFGPFVILDGIHFIIENW